MRPPYLATLALATLLLGSGCDRAQNTLMSNPNAVPLRLAAADASFRLDASDRARVLRGFDTEALERLLGMVRPDMRQVILKSFQQRTREERVGHLIEINDPVLQQVLEEVWAPMWDEAKATDEQIEANHYGFPGREVAKRRRAERRNNHRSNPE